MCKRHTDKGYEKSNICTNPEEQKFKYNDKEYETMHGLNTYDYGARQYDPARITWDRMDQFCEKYYHINPYVYCAGNPIRFIDPDGRVIYIAYQDNNNQTRWFKFTGFHGKTKIDIPNNKFVKDVVESYVYNCKNGGGDMMKKAIYSKKAIYIQDSRLETFDQSSCIQYDSSVDYDSQPTIFWNPNEGTITSEGGFQSPATCLEHEMDHAIDYVSNPKAHKQRSQISDDKYDTKEERRVTTGSEARQAKFNSESRRYNHRGRSYKTKDPTRIPQRKK